MAARSVSLVLACLAYTNSALGAYAKTDRRSWKEYEAADWFVESLAKMQREKGSKGTRDMEWLRAWLLAVNPALPWNPLPRDSMGKQVRALSTRMGPPEADSPSRQVWPAVDLTPGYQKFESLPNPSITRWSKIKGPDPFKLVEKDLKPLADYVDAVDSRTKSNPVLTSAASTFFAEKADQRLRPTIVALLGRTLGDGSDDKLRSRQVQLGQVTEMIHVATVIHDEVFENDEIQEGGYSTKVAAKVLGGDYLLARASVLLAKLQHSQVVELMASALDSLVQGQMALREQSKDLEDYLQKSWLKTASLISSSCKSSALISGYEENHDITQAAEEFGYHFGIAYQIVDDILSFKKEKKPRSELQASFATAPILYASEVEPALKPLLQRNFSEKGDVAMGFKLAKGTDCIERSYHLAEFHAQKGLEALQHLPAGEGRDALKVLMHRSLSRKS